MPCDGTPRILISRLSAIGDCILTMPVLCALRRQFPNAMLAWIIQSASAPLLRGHDCLDELLVVPRRWLASPGELARARRQVRALRCDYVIDPQSLAKSAIAGWLSGARQRIGFAPPAGRELSHWLDNVRVTPRNSHVVLKQLELLEPLGVTNADVEFRVPAFADESARVRAWLGELIGHRFMVMNPGAGWPSRRWPAARFAEVACHVGRHHNLPTVVVWGSEAECGLAETIRQKAHGHAVMAPATSLGELASVLRSSQLMIASDTGPLHLAAAVGTPCIGLHGPTRPCDSGPYGAGHIALQAYYQSGTCRQRRSASNDAMRAIPVAQVVDSCDTLMSHMAKAA